MNNTFHKAGFIHLLGKPNAGKSTLFNHLIRLPLAITTPKAQTTRHTLVGIDSGDDYQAVYVDTPGYLTPAYPLQEAMMREVKNSIPGSDIACWVVDIHEEATADFFPSSWKKKTSPAFLLINKRDLLPKERGVAQKVAWEAVVPPQVEVILISALCKADVKALRQKFKALLPTHPPYYDKDMLTDRPHAFVLSEILRKHLLLHCRQEIPYSAQVEITQINDSDDLVRVEATIYLERASQKNIVISQLKEIGTAAREEMEAFLQKKVFLTQYVKVAPKWRHTPNLLNRWGYHT